jgi:phosphoserine aminotransferase
MYSNRYRIQLDLEFYTKFSIMKNIFFTVGPSQLYPTVPQHLKTALDEDIFSLSHRSEAFKQLNKQTHANLRQLLNIPKSHHIFYTGCALEAMERVIENTAQKHVFSFVNGSFSREFYQTAVDLKKEVLRHDAANGEGFDLADVTIPKTTELICLVHNETSTGVSQPLDNIAALKKANQDALIAMDIVSSAPYVSVDFSVIDIAFFSVQKGFGLPAGLGVIIVNDKAIEKARWLAEKNIAIGSYHNFLKLAEFEEKFQTRETPNVLGIYLLGKIAGDMLERGIETIRKETDQKAKLLNEFFENHKDFKQYVATEYRSKTTIVIDVNGDSESVVNRLAEQGFIVAQGYGKRKDQHIRIGNFPTHTIEDVKNLLRYI